MRAPTRDPRRPSGLLAVLVTTFVATSCAAVPELPPPVPQDVVPSVAPPTLSAAGSDQLSPDGFDAVQRMAVRIRNVGCASLSTGSGFAVDEHTLITNRHVVADSESLQVSTYDGRDLDVSAASTAALADLAVVRTEDPLPSFPQIADDDPEEGDDVTVVGYPAGGRLTVTAGRVIGTTRDPLHENLGEVLVTDAPVEPGSSGSAALDDDGDVIGVVYAKTTDGRSLLVPQSTLREMLDDTSAFTELTPC
ncbi:trypsin-like peptidase [Isoptericola sp. CG 20/1183]|uniref:Trypsin-like peptidase n=1 Tax=Isoptericola halotolerans TaxID=300560 RepID=A0ABX5EF99_9MICO|nr:trypsin-like peptidase [Isoptericola halotolerans]PRZ06115.1 trypsin-like peptidase [Isoptericola sp. CG 20/1183]